MKAAAIIAVFLAVLSRDASCANLRMLYIVQAGYQPRDIQARAEEYRRVYGKEIKLTFAQYEEVYGLIGASSKSATADFDVVLADLIWMDDYLSRGILEQVPEKLSAKIAEGIVSAIYRPFEKDGKFWAFPFLANHKLFYVDTALLRRAGFSRPPSTLEEMVAMARAAKRSGIIKYPIFASWDKAEALICDFTLLVGAFGGNLVDENGLPRVDSPPCAQALQFMASLLETGLASPYSLRSDEVFAAEAFLMGDVLFETNWTFVTGRMQDNLYGKSTDLTAALIPVSRSVRPRIRTSTVSGYQGLAVMRNSGMKGEAWRFVDFLASPEFQRQHLSEMSVWTAVWNEPRTRQIDPEIGLKMTQLEGVHDRIGHPRYRMISLILQDALYGALTRKDSPAHALRNAQKRIEALE
ncbi:MAG: extracellular solute-binding protein [Spirochaetia bacterium]